MEEDGQGALILAVSSFIQAIEEKR